MQRIRIANPPSNTRIITSTLVSVLIGLAFYGNSQVVEKVADLNFTASDGVGYGGYAPLDRFTQVGSNLWFTTSKGGTFDAGTISRFELTTSSVVQVASLDNLTGKAPESSLLVIGNEGYFTTVNGGAGNRGTIAKIALESGAVVVLHDFATNGLPTGQTPRAGLTKIGDALWTTTSSGGTSNRGTIVRYSPASGLTEVVTNLDGRLLGGQAFSGLAAGPSNTWYFTTFTGGNTFGEPGLALGAGTLGRLTFNESGFPLISKVADLAAGHSQFPATEPLAVGNDSVYFTTTGPNSSPGAIIKYQPGTGTWATVFSFTTNAAELAAYGSRPGYSGLLEWLGDLYFINRLGGSSNLGTVVKFNTRTQKVTKLADLEGSGAESLGSASGFFGTGTLVEDSGRFYIYYPLTSGGANNRGTIIRVNLPPPPILARLDASQTGELVLSWTGGYGPFTVQSRSTLQDGVWTTITDGLTSRSVGLGPIESGSRYFRIQGSE